MNGMSFREASRHLTLNEPIFELSNVEIRGIQYRAFKNIPPHTRALMQASWEAQDNGQADYLVFGDQRWTFDVFMNDVYRTAHVLAMRFGVVKNTRVAIAMRNCPEYLVLIMAISSLGGVTVFLNAWWTTEELNYALDDSQAKLIFADADRYQRLKPLSHAQEVTLVGVRDGETLSKIRFSDLMSDVENKPAPDVEIDTDDDFAIMYSSGTTGHPKGVVQTHRGAMNAVFTWLMQAAMAPLIDPPEPNAPAPLRPAAIIVTPLFHVTATHPLFLLSMPAGAKLAVMAKWDANEAARIVDREKITRFLGVPTQSADLIEAAQSLGLSLDSLDYLGSGGAKRPPAQVETLARSFPKANVATGWGMTETNANGIGMAGDDYLKRPESAGRLYPPIQEMKLIGENGREVPLGAFGEITVKSPCNMRCYLNKPKATADVLQDGWLRTGDLARMDAEGFVTIVDRRKNIIIRGGENIACLDVEAALHRHPAIAEACVFSIPHERLGEVVGAAVQIRAGQSLTTDDLTRFLVEHIAQFKLPAQVWMQSSPLPRGATDKIDRRSIRANCLASLGKKAL
jgi:long-chain acyl-CoA synthetase